MTDPYQKPQYNPYEIFQPDMEWVLQLWENNKENIKAWVIEPVELPNNRFKLEHPRDYPLFKPTKTFLKEVIKELNHAAKNNRDQLRELTGNAYDLLGPMLLEEKERIERRIRDYQWRIKKHERMGQHGPSITNQHILQAKERSILDYYHGKTRKAGKDSIGLCEFHDDQHASFAIYRNGTRFKCFSCGAEGDTIDYIKRIHSLTFIGAVKFILHL